MEAFAQPLPKATINAMFDDWEGVIARHECASLISLPIWDKHYRIPQFMVERQVKLPQNLNLISINLQALRVESRDELVQKLNDLKNSHKCQTVYFILDGDWLLTGVPHLLPVLQTYVLNPYRTTSFLVFFGSNLLNSKFGKYLPSGHALLQNVFYLKLYTEGDMRHFLQHMAALYRFHLRPIDREKIIKNCGGHIWLVTEALRFLHAKNSLSFTHDTMQIKLQKIWEACENEEKQVLKNVVLGKATPFDLQETFKFLERLGLVKALTNSKAEINVPILADYIRDQVKKELVLSVTTLGEVLVGSANVTSLFSQRERALIRHLLTHQGEIIDRDTVGNILWSEDTLEGYSDWALNQAIKRLRKRLFNLGLNHDFVKTVKGQGFIYGDKTI